MFLVIQDNFQFYVLNLYAATSSYLTWRKNSFPSTRVRPETINKKYKRD